MPQPRDRFTRPAARLRPLPWLALPLVLAACAVVAPETPDMSTRPSDFSLTYNWYEGSLPPPYHYEYTVAVAADGAGTITMVPDYPAPDVPVWTETFTVASADLDALYLNLAELGAFTTAWEAEEMPPVGGSYDTLTLTANGASLTIPDYVVADQRGARGEMSALISGLVPPEAWATLDAQREEYVRDNEE